MFGRDRILKVKHAANWYLIGQSKQKLIFNDHQKQKHKANPTNLQCGWPSHAAHWYRLQMCATLFKTAIETHTDGSGAWQSQHSKIHPYKQVEPAFRGGECNIRTSRRTTSRTPLPNFTLFILDTLLATRRLVNLVVDWEQSKSGRRTEDWITVKEAHEVTDRRSIVKHKENNPCERHQILRQQRRFAFPSQKCEVNLCTSDFHVGRSKDHNMFHRWGYNSRGTFLNFTEQCLTSNENKQKNGTLHHLQRPLSIRK